MACRNDKKPNDIASQDSVKEKKTSVPGGLKNIVFFGNSLTAGYGVEESEAFPALIQEKIDSLKLPYKVINAGVSGETSAGGKSRIDWISRLADCLPQTDRIRGVWFGQDAIKRSRRNRTGQIASEAVRSLPRCRAGLGPEARGSRLHAM